MYKRIKFSRPLYKYKRIKFLINGWGRVSTDRYERFRLEIYAWQLYDANWSEFDKIYSS